MVTGDVDELTYLEITWIHPRIDSLDCGGSCPISISNDPKGIARFNGDVVYTCRDRAARDDCNYEEPTCCQSNSDTWETAHPGAD